MDGGAVEAHEAGALVREREAVHAHVEGEERAAGDLLGQQGRGNHVGGAAAGDFEGAAFGSDEGGDGDLVGAVASEGRSNVQGQAEGAGGAEDFKEQKTSDAGHARVREKVVGLELEEGDARLVEYVLDVVVHAARGIEEEEVVGKAAPGAGDEVAAGGVVEMAAVEKG